MALHLLSLSMDAIGAIFAHLCGQGRCFIVDGAALPACQRCMGLYLGALLTLLWLGASKSWRCGLPGRKVLFLQGAMLLLAGLGGVHVLDPGPRWRLACGLWTGHVLTSWFIAAAAHLRGFSHPWRPGQSMQAGLALPALSLLAAGADFLLPLGWGCWTFLISLGAVGLFASALLAIAALLAWSLKALRKTISMA